MKCFLLQEFQKDKRDQLLRQHKLLPVSIILSLFSMPLCAQSNYLFPSDIIDQTEQAQYDIGRENRYETHKQWFYPNTSQFKNNRPVYSDSNQQRRINHNGMPKPGEYSYDNNQDQSNQYQSNQYQRQNSQSYSNQVEPGTDWYGESERYKYGDFKSGQIQSSFSDQQNQSQTIRQQPYFSSDVRYPEENKSKLYDAYNAQKNYQATYRNQFDNMKYQKKPLLHSDLLYPSDLVGDRWSKRNASYNSNPFNFNSFDSYPDFDQKLDQKHDQNRQNVQIQYVPVPVPVYSVPGTLPGTVPGVVTPGNMVPGYSHLSPDLNNGYFNGGSTINSLLNQSLNQRINSNLMQKRIPGSNLLNRNGHQRGPINSFKGVGGFPGMTSPFDTHYKSFENHSQMTKPFSETESMIPGISMPSMFSSQ